MEAIIHNIPAFAGTVFIIVGIVLIFLVRKAGTTPGQSLVRGSSGAIGLIVMGVVLIGWCLLR